MTLGVVSPQATGKTKKAGKPRSAQEQLAASMVAQAQEQGLALAGPDGLLKQLTKTVLEAALNAEMTEHLGHEKRRPKLVVRARTCVTARGRRPSYRML
jgi:transposase-like protein